MVATPRYGVWSAHCADPTKIGVVPLEPCPVCGYALSMVDHHCRHCAAESRRHPVARFSAKHLQQLIVAVVVLSVIVYLIFFR